MTYTYGCEKCGDVETDQRMTDDALTKCPQCGGDVSRLITGGTGFVLKGGGWFSDSYANAGNKDRQKFDKETQ